MTARTADRRLLYVLALVEAGMSLLATLGGAIFAGGNPLYIGIGTAIAALYVVAGQAASHGGRWGFVTLIVCECVRLTGFGLSTILSLLPAVRLTLTGATLTDGLILPTIVVVMAAVQLIRRETAPPAKEQLPTTLALPTAELIG